MKQKLGTLYLFIVLALALTCCNGTAEMEGYCGGGGDFLDDGLSFVISYDQYPNGDPVVADTGVPADQPDGPYVVLSGDEFEDCGINIGTVWDNFDPPNWDLSNRCIVIHPAYYGTGSFLVKENAPDCVSRSLHITFLAPVRDVSIQFIGASVNYYLVAYDQDGNELGMTTHLSTFVPNEYPRQTIEFQSDQNNIESIKFIGAGVVIEAIEQLSFARY